MKKAQKSHFCTQREDQIIPVGQREAPRTGDRLVSVRHIEHPHQHDQRSGEGIDKELDRRIEAQFPSPGTDNVEHRDQRELPEEVEDDRIERDEHADHRHLEEEQRDDHVLDVFFDTERNDPYQGHQGRHDDDKKADAVHPDIIADPKIGYQRNPFDELHRAAGGIECEPEPEGEEELYGRYADTVGANPFFADHQSEDTGDQRKEDQNT